LRKVEFVMTAIKSIESLGHDVSFFKIRQTEDEKGTFVYYTFDKGWRLEDMTNWNIIGIRQRNKEHFLLDVQLMHIEEVALAWKPFDAIHDADGSIHIYPAEFLIFIDFLESFVKEQSEEECNMPSHFSLMKREELVALHFNAHLLNSSANDFYLYTPNEKAQHSDQISIISPPSWSSTTGQFQSNSISFITFDVQRLEEPVFDQLDVEGLGRMTFNQCALKEIIALLKKYTFEGNVESHT